MTVSRTRAERLGDLLTGWVDRLPPRLRRYLPRELAGFAILGGFTFGLDLAALTMLRHWAHMPRMLAVAVAYIGAFGINFALNRTVNFRSHAPVGRQILRYAVVLVCDFLITVLVTTALSMAGLHLLVARVLASGFVAVFTYSASRWWVFRDRPAAPSESVPTGREDSRSLCVLPTPDQ